MQLNIKNGDAYRLAAEIARQTGQSLSATVTDALREKRDRMRSAKEEGLIAKWLELTKASAELWEEPWKSQDHGDLLYDELGLPK